MALKPMRFKNYTWPHNPKFFEVTRKRRLSVNHIPFGKFSVRDMGEEYRVFKGEGEFCGENAYEEFKKLESVFKEGTYGILVHPVIGSENVYFSSLTLKEEPMTDYVRYSFEFSENCTDFEPVLKQVTNKNVKESKSTTAKSSTQKKTYTVTSGDNLWSIASRFGISYSEIIRVNPQIKNPNLIYPGDVIYISEG